MFMIIIYQFLTFLVGSLSDLTWSLFYPLWGFDCSSGTCSGVYHSPWHSPVCHQTQYAWSQFLGSAGWECPGYFPSHLSLCICVMYMSEISSPAWLILPQGKCHLTIHSLLICSSRYYSVVIGVLHIILMLCVICLPLFITLMIYDWSWWSVPYVSSITLCVHGPPSLYWTATIDYKEKENESL